MLLGTEFVVKIYRARTEVAFWNSGLQCIGVSFGRRKANYKNLVTSFPQ